MFTWLKYCMLTIIAIKALPDYSDPSECIYVFFITQISCPDMQFNARYITTEMQYIMI